MIIKKIILLIFVFTFNLSYAIDLNNNSTIHGFGTLGGSYNTNEHFIYRDTVFSDVGSKEDFSFATHSKFGLQLETYLNESLKATIQGVVYQKKDDSIEKDLDWAYLKYSPNDNINFKLGRMRVPFFIFSDSSNINFTNIWTHTPKEAIIAAVPFSSYNGFETEFLHNFKEHNLSLQIYTGKGEDTIKASSTDVEVELERATGFSLTDYYGDLKLRTSYIQIKNRFGIPPLEQLYSFASMMGFEEIKNYSFEKLDVDLYTLGFTYQINNIFLASEYTLLDLNNNLLNTLSGWYISSGYQFDKIMPYLTYGQSNQKIASSTIALPPPFYDAFDTMIKEFNFSQESISLGVRYDIYKNLALKTQVDRIFYDENRRTMYYRDGNEDPKGHLDVFSITLDFVF